jgi:DNA-binding transcriptional regulator PaaX
LAISKLPIQLLPPDWIGIKAAKQFSMVREQLMPQAQLYIGNIIGE